MKFNIILFIISLFLPFSLIANQIEFTPKEKQYIKNQKVLKMCVDPDWMPLEKIDENGNYIGVLSEYAKLFSNRSELKFSLQKTKTYKESREYLTAEKCDIIIADVATPLVKKSFLTTKPYFIMPRAFAIHTDTKGVQNFSQIVFDGKIGVLLNSPAESILKKIYKDIELLPFENITQGLNAVATKQTIAYVGAMSPVIYNIQNNGLLNAGFSEHNLVVNYENSQKIYSNGFPNELGQALINIINNAKDALVENEIADKVLVVHLEEQEDRAILTVSDNAGGIPDDIIDQIFDPYFSTKAAKNGTGLGLYMTKLIIEEHLNGKISVENRGDGATFNIILKAGKYL